MTSVAESDRPASAVAPAGLRARGLPDATVAIVGLGYVGLPTAISFAQAGHQVLGLDINPNRLAAISRGAVDLIDDDRAALDTVLRDQLLDLSVDPDRIADADVVVICVPTPLDTHFLPELDALRSACADVVRRARPGQLLLLTSTTYAGTTRELLADPLRARGLEVGADINVAFSPERINPGDQSHPLASVPRVVGGTTPWCADRAKRLLERVADEVHVVSTTDSAELTKLFENTFRAVNISLVNEFANACTELGADVIEVLDAAATKPYGFMRFSPGPGVGGHCIPCDPHYLLWQLRRLRLRLPIVESAMQAIERRPLEVVTRVRGLLGHLGLSPGNARILVVGVAYKPDIEDVRESPAVEIVSRLSTMGANVTITDAHAPQLRLTDGTVLPCLRLADVDVADYDLVVLHTRHNSEDHGVLRDARLILDATYRLDDLPQRVVL